MASPLFRDFSFSASASQHNHEADRAAMNVSPTSMLHHQPTRLSTISSSYSVGDLVSRFDQHLHVEVEEDPSCAWPTTGLLLDVPAQDLIQPPRYSCSRISSTIMRMQRQSNTRLQCSSSHVKDISRLVERMVEDEVQCNIRDAAASLSLPALSPTTSSASSSSDEDEAIDMEFAPDRIPLYALNFRRSSDRTPGSATISRNIRMRKSSSRITKRSSK